MRKIIYIVTAAAGLFLTACEHYGETSAPRETLQITADVKIAEVAAGKYSFTYNAPFFKENGDLDFSQKGAKGHTIALTFKIADGSVPGIKFMADAPDGIWIVDKKNLPSPTDSPSMPYRGNQFYDFKVSEDGQTLSLTDQNDDGVLYRYALRFDLNGDPVVHDPDAQNGGHD